MQYHDKKIIDSSISERKMLKKRWFLIIFVPTFISNMKTDFRTVFVICFGITSILGQSNFLNIDKKLKEAYPDIHLTITQLFQKYDYPVETHEVTTKDDYILTIFRIPHGRNSNEPNPKPILLMHGLLSQAEHFGMTNISIARYLADHGYDVWLGNARGTQHGRRHKTLNPNQKEFWDFSFHEIGIFDLPAMVDHILETSGKSKLSYVGHSQGGSVFHIMCTMMPEYQDKIAIASLMGPAGFMKYFNNTVLRFLSNRHEYLWKLSNRLESYEFPFKIWSLQDLATVCASTTFRKLCYDFIVMFMGVDSGEMNMMDIPLLLKFMPSASTKQVLHFAQNAKSGHFRPWDYGKDGNRKIYGKDEPDDYPVKNIKVPIAFYYSQSDDLTFPQDIKDMCAAIQNCIRLYEMPNKKWSHIDFFLSRNANTALNQPLVEFADKYENDNHLFD